MSRTTDVLRWVRRASLVFGTLLLTFCVLEVGVRAYAALFVPGRSFFRDDRLTSPWFLTYEAPPPYWDAAGSAWFHHGRGPVSPEKDEEVTRVMALGGSTTVNRRSVDRGGRDYASCLEEFLNAPMTDGRFEVLNGGGDAFSTAHTLTNMQLRLMELQPDVVVLMHNINDLSVNYYGEGAQADYSNKYLRPFFVNPTLQAGTSWRGFLNQSRLIAATGLLGVFDQGELSLENGVETGLPYFRRNLRAIADLCQREGVELVLLTQPSQMRPVAYYDREHFQRYNEAIAQVAEEAGCRLIDMHALFGQDPELFVDEFHYSPKGVERFAAILAEEW